jgi:hypothetical protein
MEKVRLDVEDLQVQSFATTWEMAEERGTVRGHAPSDEVECYTANNEWNSCWATCDCQNDWTVPCTDDCDYTNYGVCSGSWPSNC